MADNFIEKKYAEYELRKAAWLKKQKHALKRKPIAAPAPQPQKPQNHQESSTTTKP